MSAVSAKYIYDGFVPDVQYLPGCTDDTFLHSRLDIGTELILIMIQHCFYTETS